MLATKRDIKELEGAIHRDIKELEMRIITRLGGLIVAGFATMGVLIKIL